MKTAFKQSIDADRPHTLLTVDTKRSGSLEYRYDDTQEVISVPNIWYNQTYQIRVEFMRGKAKLQDEMANKFKKNPTLGLSQAAVDQIVDRHRVKAVLMQAEADRMEAAGVQSHPVAASHMKLDYEAIVV